MDVLPHLHNLLELITKSLFSRDDLLFFNIFPEGVKPKGRLYPNFTTLSIKLGAFKVPLRERKLMNPSSKLF